MAARLSPRPPERHRGCLLFLLVVLAAGIVAAAPQTPPTHPLTGRRIANIYTNSSWLDRAERETEEQPDRALALIGILRGMVVADVGAGTGYMTVRLARLVGTEGKVYANDLQATMLARVQDRVRRENLSNVVSIQGTATETRLPADAIDLALLVDVYHEFWYPQ